MPSRQKTLTDKLIAAAIEVAREKNINVLVDFDGPSAIVTLVVSNRRTSFSVYENCAKPMVTHLEPGNASFRYMLHDKLRKAVEKLHDPMATS